MAARPPEQGDIRRHFDPSNPYQQGGFSEWADLVFDGSIDQHLDIVLQSFGKRTGE